MWLLWPQPEAGGQCIDISDAPMDTKVEAAAPLIMFVLDNSGSMDWEFMTPENDGKFQEHEYVFDDPGDNTYIPPSSNSDILSGTDRGKWMSQWAGYNRIYYDPAVDYAPWPLMDHADTMQPRSNPIHATPTFDLSAEYFAVSPDIVVDNDDPGFSLSTGWSIWSASTDYEEDYYYVSDSQGGQWAQWTPNLPVSGEYEVFAWWVSNSSRRTDVSYTIYHGGTTTTVTGINQQQSGGQWNSLGTFYFDAGDAGYVKINATVPGVSTYCADAVKFVRVGSTAISVKNAHYYILDDADGDGEVDPAEDVYLVNFVAGTREFYRYNDLDGDGLVESGELWQLSELPDNLKPKLINEQGEFVRYKSDAEELQNLADWYSYYRRRELTAKAAVANAIYTLHGVQVGFYSINSGLRQTVLPVKLLASSLIIDNMDSGYTESGRWSESSASDEYRDSSRYTNATGSTATFRPNITEAGEYKVYAWWDYWSTRDTNALYTVAHAGGTASVRVNQRENYSQWTLLGTYSFNAGTSGYVRVSRDSQSTGSSTSADAVMFEPVSGSLNLDETDTLLNLLYGLDSTGYTPLRSALKALGQYYSSEESSALGASPYADAASGGECQQAFAIAMTDGYWNGSSPDVGNQDGTEGEPYADGYGDTLADVAMKYYKTDLAPGLEDTVPTNSCDAASHQHMVTYAVSFGVAGTLDPEVYHPCLLDGSTPQWPDPTTGCDSCPKKIDDLWHAAVNGRGLFFSASNPQELIDSLRELMENIESRISSGASATVNGEELGTDTVLYQSSYVSDVSTGTVTAYPVDPLTGEIQRESDDILWDASDQLQMISPDNRRIVTYDGGNGGIPFQYASLTPDQKSALDPGWQLDSTLAENRVRYIRGEEIEGFRSRSRKLGDIVHSAPLLVRNTIFAGANDGMLHAFDAAYGTERFAYVPNLVFSNLAALSTPGYSHLFYVDSTPSAAMGVGNDPKTLLVGGFGKGGRGYYALDITNADNIQAGSSESDAAAMVLWEYPRSGVTDDDLGFTFSKPFVVESYSATYPWVILFGNGYDSPNGHAILYALDLEGNVVKKIDTGVGGCNGLSTPSVVDVDNDYKADYAYAGDLKGNLWKFDFRDPNPDNWAVAFGDGVSPQPLFQATGQPITSKPDVMRHCQKHGYMVVFATGKYLGDSDRADTSVQTIYGIWDYGDDNDDDEYLGSFQRGSTPQLSNQPESVTLLQQTVLDSRIVAGHRLITLTDNAPQWTTTSLDSGGSNCGAGAGEEACDPDGVGTMPDPLAHAGWYFDLSLEAERGIRDALIREGKAIMLTIIPSGSPCSGGGDSLVYELNACSGARLQEPQFDIDEDRDVDQDDRISVTIGGEPQPVAPTATSFPGVLYPPVMLRMPDHKREMKVFSSSAGTTETLFEVAEKRGLFYWLEITQ